MESPLPLGKQHPAANTRAIIVPDKHDMSISEDRIRQLVARRLGERNLSLAAASRMLGRNPAYLQQYLERGVPVSLPEKMRLKIARLIQCDEQELRTDEELALIGDAIAPARPSPNVSPPQPEEPRGRTHIPKDLPVLGRAQGGPDGALRIETDERPIDWTWRPAALAGAAGAFGLFVDGDSMTSAGLPHGATVFVHPHRRPKAGDIVVLVKNSGEAFIKRHVKTAAGAVTLEQTDPSKTFRVAESDIKGLYLVVGWLVGG